MSRLMVSLGLVAGVACAGPQATPPTDTTPPAAETPPAVVAPPVAEAPPAEAPASQLIVVSANFDSDAPCGKRDGAGCDLYAVQYSPEQEAVVSVTRLLDTPGVAEQFPTVDREQQFVVYTEQRGRALSLQALHIPTGTRHALVEGGRYASFSPTASELVYSSVQRARGKTKAPAQKEVSLGSYASDGGRLSLSGVQVISQGRDPQFSPDGRQVVFHVRPPSEETRPAVYDLDQGKVSLMEGARGCAHTTFSQDGQTVFCGEGAQVHTYPRSADGWGARNAWTAPTLPARFGGDCRFTSMSFPDFCPNGQDAVFSVGCHDGGATRFSQVLLVDMATQDVVDLHGLIEDFLGVSGKASRSADCAG